MTASHPHSSGSHPSHNTALLTTSLAALGVVFGDIGTSPLYALRECFHGPHAIEISRQNVLGILSLIFWSLNLVISIKYLIFILRADNQGEGGILALTALVTPLRAVAERRRWFLVTLGLIGAALLYADGMITPAISVLSAVEGLEYATPVFGPYLQPITIVILIVLFFFQSHGTARVGAIFGPITLAWFIVMGLLGLRHLVQSPDVLVALNPYYAMHFFWANGWSGFAVLGTVFLVVTGGEALYADIGHFGTQPIRLVWVVVALPALLTCYFGQGAFLLSHPQEAAQPFYAMAPTWFIYPLVALATFATIVASQAIITGAFSLTLQAIQLGYCPRMKIDHTSADQIGQIYVGVVNWMLMIASIGLVVGFGSSSELAAAYGIAITITMVITTMLFFELLVQRWKWSLPVAIAMVGGFLAIDTAYFLANIVKVAQGGWFPLAVAIAIYILMSTWMTGRDLLRRRLRERMLPLELFLADVLTKEHTRVPGVAIFLYSNRVGTPPALRHNFAHNQVLHEKTIIITVETADRPRVTPEERFEIEEVGEGFFRVVLTYGFMDAPNVPADLAGLKIPGVDLAASKPSYFIGRETLLVTKNPGMALWREQLFVWMSRNAQTANHFFHLPADQVIEVGLHVEL